MDGAPSARLVLLKGVDARGFTIYTNLESRKARELAANPRAALCFYWLPLDLQVRVEGPVSQVDDDEADAYFATRARGSQLGAWASRQSEVIESREALEARFDELQRELGEDPPLPPFWGGLRLVPDAYEFWQHRDDRLHDRFRYRRDGRAWIIERLAP